MKKNYLIKNRWLMALLLLFSASFAMAQNETTTNKLTVSELQLNPGGEEGFFTISLASDKRYSALNVDLYLPDGYEFVWYEETEYDEDLDEDVTVSLPKVYKSTSSILQASHTITANVQSTGALRIALVSMSSNALSANSGSLVDVYVRATPYVKQGFGDLLIKNCYFITTKTVQYDTADQTITDKLSASSNCSLPFTFTAKKVWSTRVFPFSMEIPEGMSVYAYSRQDGENVYLTRQQSIEAYVPYVISGEKDMNVTLTGTAVADEYTSRVLANGTCGTGALIGAITNQKVKKGYVLQSQDGGECKFYPVLDGDVFSIPTGKCWLSASAVGAKELNFVISDDVDAIQVPVSSPTSSAVYDLQGRRADASQRGIYIIDGKKVIK